MWNWNIGKSLLLGIGVATVLALAGLSIRAIVVISIAFVVFVNWLIEGINFVRNAHGTNIEELENEIEELKEKTEKKKS